MTGGEARDGRRHIRSRLMRESLQDAEVLARTEPDRERALLPDVRLVGIGGQSIFDRGASALRPLAEEIASLAPRHRLVLGVGGGTRVRHTCAIALDLGIPPGGIARLIGSMEEGNALLLNALLAQHGSLLMERADFWNLPLYHASGAIPIVTCNPPYHYWEPPPAAGALPTHGSDYGLFLHAEVLGTRHLVFVKDQDGLYDRDPRTHEDARLIERTTLSRLLADPPPTLILDEQLFRVWRDARHVERVQIVNGLVPGQLTRALDGEDVGTVITKEGA